MDSQVLRWNQQAMEVLKQGKFEESLELLEKAKQTLSSNDPALAALTHSNLGSYYAAKGESVTALACLRKALHFEQKTGHTVNIAATCLRIASAYESLGKCSKGLAYSKRTIESMQSGLAGRDPIVAKTLVLAHYESAKLYERLADYHEATKHYLKGLELAEKRMKLVHPIVIALRTAVSRLDEKASSYRFRFVRGLAPLNRTRRSLSRTKPFSAARRTRRTNDFFLKELKANAIHVTASLL